MRFFLFVLGMVLIVEGLPYFAIPRKVKAFARMLPEFEDSTLRGMGLTIILIGLGILYLAQSIWSS